MSTFKLDVTIIESRRTTIQVEVEAEYPSAAQKEGSAPVIWTVISDLEKVEPGPYLAEHEHVWGPTRQAVESVLIGGYQEATS